MKIINGKWRDQYDNPVDNFNVSELIEIADKVKALFGDDVTYDRINLVSCIRKLTKEEESDLAYLLSTEGMISKLAGY